MRKTLNLVMGAGLVVLGMAIAPLPGPGGLPVVLIGTVVLLRHSPRLRRHWVLARRRWPQAVGRLDRLLRRRHPPKGHPPGTSRRADGENAAFPQPRA